MARGQNISFHSLFFSSPPADHPPPSSSSSIHQVTSLLATQRWRRNSRKRLHFWWELIRPASTWNSSRLLRVPESWWWSHDLLRGANCSNVCPRNRGRECRGLFHGGLYFAWVEQRGQWKNKLRGDRKSINPWQKALSLAWQIKRPAPWHRCRPILEKCR